MPPTSDDKREWWYRDNQGEKQGPVSLENLLTLHEEFDIRHETLVLREGAAEWRTFHELLNERVVACKHFHFICGKRWTELQSTNSCDVRYCNDCARHVHLCESVSELHEHSRSGHCVAYRVPDEYPEFLIGDPIPFIDHEP